VLQFVLALPGSPDKGLAMLTECEDKASYAAWPCKVYRVSLLLSDRKDYRGAEPELAALLARYPGNYQFCGAVFEVLASGLNTAALRRSAEDVLRRLDQGWTPPKYAGIDPDACRLTLAKAYIQAAEPAAAAVQLKRLAAKGKAPLKAQAAALLKDLPAVDVVATPVSSPSALSASAGASLSPSGSTLTGPAPRTIIDPASLTPAPPATTPSAAEPGAAPRP
jgi:hypothetical protein